MRKFFQVVARLAILALFSVGAFAAPTIVNVQNLANGSTYTVGAGTNRVVVIVAKGKMNAHDNALYTAATWGGVSATQVLSVNDSAGGNTTLAAIYYIKESNFPGGGTGTLGSTVSGAGTATTGNGRFTVYTITDVDQTTPVRTSGSNVAAFVSPSLTVTIAQSSIVAGDVVVGGGSTRNSVSPVTTNNGFTEDLDADNGDGGEWWAVSKIAASTTETYSVTLTADDEQSSVAATFRQTSGGGGSVLNPLSGRGGAAARPLVD
jgi:hypothetical protein